MKSSLKIYKHLMKLSACRSQKEPLVQNSEQISMRSLKKLMSASGMVRQNASTLPLGDKPPTPNRLVSV